MERMLTPRPAFAAPMTISQNSLMSLSGLTGQVTKVTSGRSRSFASPPLTADAISTMRSRMKPFIGPMKPGLAVFVTHASN